jgi:hydrogenase nickel incorporation protein HypA/HybF
MHELSIAQSIVDVVREEAARHAAGRVIRIGLRIGELSGVNADALRFGFQMTVQETDLKDVDLDIEEVALRHRCTQCACEFAVADYEISCPSCGTLETRAVAGDEMQVAYLEVE